MTSTKQCPKCGYSADAEFSECPACGIIVRKFLEIEREREQYEAKDAGEARSTMNAFKETQALRVQQNKEWGEILTGFETRNKYVVLDSWNNPMFHAEEQGGSMAAFATRMFLSHLRPFTITVSDVNCYFPNSHKKIRMKFPK